jgi:hypothetical protein
MLPLPEDSFRLPSTDELLELHLPKYCKVYLSTVLHILQQHNFLHEILGMEGITF